MKMTIGTETDNQESSTEAKHFIANTPSRMLYHEAENSPSVSVTSNKLACKSGQ